MTPVDTLRQAFAEHQAVIAALEPLLPTIAQVAQEMRACLARGGKILLMGNGGSAADSQHIAAEIVGRYKKERRGLPAIALTTDTSILTSVGNDYGFDFIFSRQVEALCTPADLVIGFSTSGNSKNVVRAIETAREIGAITVSMTGGSGGKLAELCDFNLIMPSSDTPRIQEAHILIGHSLCDLVEAD
ncbi:D-sedoheptulose 7-phosphate isomerase [Methylobacillus gramineus]|uniref:D-sedoheptulose 7-phosphate isomerase n=1 Tax=Methylobacillus gramineus TaxID=755169 RepID=UPI001CFFC425|nr:D-sedoheptulose 7-phosphate isomerase [Methylobacillus gramineus]MCB5184889.1 D-sedoheptulose 7-phosphate isomerase [Methylobacillus gramineus]